MQALAVARKKTPDKSSPSSTTAVYTSKQAKAAGLIDELRYEDQVYGELKTQLKQAEVKKTDFAKYVRSLTPESDAKKRIAIVVGSGTILRGSGKTLWAPMRASLQGRL